MIAKNGGGKLLTMLTGLILYSNFTHLLRPAEFTSFFQSLNMPKQTKKKRGPPDHFTGVKYKFLAGHATAYQLAVDTRKQTEFYDLITMTFINKFGDNISTIRENPNNDAPAPDEPAANNVSETAPTPKNAEEVVALTAEEAGVKAKNYKTLRKVSEV